MSIRIRPEAPPDTPAIHAVTTAAFLHAPHTDHTEEFVVQELREAGALAVSLVATEGERIVGHVAVSPVTISNGTTSNGTRDWYGLGPISVAPDHQRRGIGSQLMHAALEVLQARGAAGCVLLGDPAYYSRFGFRTAAPLTLPGAPPEYFQSLSWSGEPTRGDVAYHAAFEARPRLRIAVLGNSGSGKSTLAARLAKRSVESATTPTLDLDGVYWEPDQPGVKRPIEASRRDLLAFCEANENWIIEGCYEELIEAVQPLCPTLLFLDPGVERCLEHCRRRPWEPHKYASKALQDERLPGLLDWVRDYYARQGEMSHESHLAFFEAYAGPKERVIDLDAPIAALEDPRPVPA